MAARYRLPDEPLPGGLSAYAVDPMWPLLALMLAGNGFGLAWFVFNGFALGSPSRTREWAYITISLIGSVLILSVLGLMASNDWLQASELRYAGLTLIALKLVCGYALYLSQQRSCELWEYFGGKLANGVPILILLVLIGRNLMQANPMPSLLSGVLQ